MLRQYGQNYIIFLIDISIVQYIYVSQCNDIMSNS
ncbi:hypothetical protein Hamer_G027324 [Homarus americanus]|uniref:Uncharacterized protein n=1 Tax=Homarus americanus TaxID=6706 RepID=A0A8J5JEI4_HOMAM|nr:hypothetical protein Hamer_G027324 [Homarus americanus]